MPRDPGYEAWSLSVAAGRPFFGRSRELAELQRGLRRGRLVTITGTAGVGKTRLVQRFLDLPGARAVFVDLAGARTAEDVVGAAREAVGLPPGSPTAFGDSLVVLDNFEQVADHAAATVGAWLRAEPAPRFVVTSRARLGLVDEVTIPLEPFETPADARSDAVRLFVARVRAVSGRNPLDETPEAVFSLVKALDGLPLAIELAAGRATVLGVPTLLERVTRDTDVLRSARPDLPDRQTTLQKAIAWSWDLLGPEARTALAQSSGFSGDFGIDAAEAVLDGPVIDLIQRLCDGSLIQASPDERGELRFRLYASVREFAEARLGDEEQGRVLARYDAWTLGRDWDALPDERLAQERHHLQAVLAHAGPADALRAASHLARLPDPAPPAARIARLDALLVGELPADALVRGLLARADLLGRTGRMAEQQADLARALGAADTEGLRALVASPAALARLDAGDVDGALALAPTGLAGATALSAAGRHDEARLRALEALPGARAPGPLLARLGAIEADLGDLDTAREHLERAVAALPTGRDLAQYHRGLLLQRAGDLDAARAAWLDGLAGAGAVGRGLCEAALGAAAALAADREESARRLTIADELAAVARVPRLTWPVRLLRAVADAASGVPERLERARAALEAAPGDVPEARPARRLLAHTLRAGERGDLVVGPESRWFSVHGRPPVDLVRRGAMKRMVEVLVERRLSSPGVALTNAELFEAGWPGEHIRDESAAHRVRVAVSSLRKMGLADVMERTDAGYLLRADVDVRREA